MDTHPRAEWFETIERKKQQAGFTEPHRAILDMIELRFMAGPVHEWELPRLVNTLQLVPPEFRSINFDGEAYCCCTDKPICAYCQGQDPECSAGGNHARDCQILALIARSVE